MLPLTVWMNMPSFYQDDLFRAIVETGRTELRVIFARKMAGDRLRLGWSNSISGYEWVVLDGSLAAAVRAARSGRNRFHVVNGIWAEPTFAAALTVLCTVGSPTAIYSEAPNPGAKPSLPSRVVRSTFGRWAARRTGAFAVSHFAADFYAELGVDRARLYPFAYFRDCSFTPPAPEGKRRELIYAGQLIRRKGVDTLLSAFAAVAREDRQLSLALVGTGAAEQELRQQGAQLGIGDRVAFEGVLSSDRITGRIAAASALVLPSRWDGWGLVVNEAFAAGVPVIVSDKCGAADLVRDGVNGFVFGAEKSDELADCIRRLFASDAQHLRRNARATFERLTPKVAATYLLDCLEHMTSGSKHPAPLPPWVPPPLAAEAHFCGPGVRPCGS
jgi:glycosyltransferase involved in cell wall biosynthesis